MTDQLQQARRHHRHALRALREGCYDSLSPGTRDRLVQRLKTGLVALNRTLDEEAAVQAEPSGDGAEEPIDCLET
ncbi:hypothetical protein [Salinibacter altiplanensis]|uniref:hypothetical protein n=1 Tax=Salinibacter altiplanensis TaxID=1803181 RepID=UPI000C9F3D0C|nr:hypothetical protein [Salinibacter altiplanensis]